MIINYGASFGLSFGGLVWVQIFLLVLLGIGWWREKKAWGFLLMILGGGLNFTERWCLGGVRDYWHLPFTSIYNNINDYLIVVGAIQLMIYFIWKKKQK